MSSNQPTPRLATQQKNPVDLLEMQVQILRDLYQQQLKQNKQIEQLCSTQDAQTKKITDIVESLKAIPQVQDVRVIKQDYGAAAGLLGALFILIGIFAPWLIVANAESSFTKAISAVQVTQLYSEATVYLLGIAVFFLAMIATSLLLRK